MMLYGGIQIRLNLDVHYHSGYAGGTGNIKLEDFLKTGPLKGIDVVGCGDCLHEAWLSTLKERFIEDSDGIFTLKEHDDGVKFILQTELIFTCAVKTGRKSVHIVFLFPSFEVIDKMLMLFKKWDVKNTIGRPFVKCKDNKEVGERILKIFDLDEFVEIIPAHVMTPNGIYGSQNPINYLKEFFDEAVNRIQLFETGLSADQYILSLIPELDDKTLISNSDAHSPALNRLGREFTSIEVRSFKYNEIIKSLRENNVIYTSEFNPTEGKYFLTGHRSGKSGHNKSYCVYSPKYVPKDGICPICGKKLTIGVLQRAFEINKAQGEKREFGFLPKGRKNFVHMVPLIEIISTNLGVKSINSKKIQNIYLSIVKEFGDECDLWFTEPKEIRKKLEGIVSDGLIEDIIEIRNGNFCFEPLGFDGAYGELKIGKTVDIFEVKNIYIDDETQKLIENRNKENKKKNQKNISNYIK
ncbi:MAG: endonuclease Q family protein [Candidatus Helarchaeota archaeon]